MGKSPTSGGGRDQNRLPELKRSQERESAFSIILKTALLLGGVLILGIGLRWGFSWVAIDEPPRAELYSKSLDGRRDLRRAAVLEWSRRLQSSEDRGSVAEVDELRPTAEESARLRLALASEENRESLYLSGLAQVLSFSRQTHESAEAFCAQLESFKEAELPEAQIFLLLGLGRLLRVEASAYCPALLARAESPEPALRKTLAFSLGLAAQNPELAARREDTLALLGRIFSRGEEDERWNAAFAAAAWGDPLGRSVIDGLLEEALNVGAEGVPVLDALRTQALESALKAAVELKDPDLRGKVEQVARTSKSLGLRQTAMRVLESR